jgi:hypothetical protein
MTRGGTTPLIRVRSRPFRRQEEGNRRTTPPLVCMEGTPVMTPGGIALLSTCSPPFGSVRWQEEGAIPTSPTSVGPRFDTSGG